MAPNGHHKKIIFLYLNVILEMFGRDKINQWFQQLMYAVSRRYGFHAATFGHLESSDGMAVSLNSLYELILLKCSKKYSNLFLIWENEIL